MASSTRTNDLGYHAFRLGKLSERLNQKKLRDSILKVQHIIYLSFATLSCLFFLNAPLTFYTELHFVSPIVFLHSLHLFKGFMRQLKRENLKLQREIKESEKILGFSAQQITV